MSAAAGELRIEAGHGGTPVARFIAMGSPCEVLVDGADADTLQACARLAADEAWRIEAKWSRYRPGNIVDRINRADGEPVEVDEETARLIDYAHGLHAMSDGLFDLSSGVLRAVWRFDGSDRLPTPAAVAAVLARVGWQRAEWRSPVLRLAPGMEIDFGGLGKEYAVDRARTLLEQAGVRHALVNFGGDLAVTGPRRDGSPWQVGIEIGATGRGTPLVRLAAGAAATSGDSHRYLLRDGVRYPHLLDPRSGWPVIGGPRAVTVLAATCTEAGVLSTLAMLHGPDARSFLARMGAMAQVFD